MNIESVVISNGAVLNSTDLLVSVRHRESRELVIADASIKDADVLSGHLQPGIDLWRVDADTDFSGMLHSALSCGYERLHFLAHGQPGGISFCGKVREAEDFTALSGDGLAPSLHFWSCMTGAGEKGRAFVQRLSTAFGSVVTAFSDLVGAASKGGSWLPDVLSSNSGRVVTVPFMNCLAYAHTLGVSPALKLTSVVTATGVDVQVRLAAGTVIDNAELVLSYDPAKASYTGVTGNPALTGWTLLSNPDPYSSGHLLIGGYSLTSINSTSDIVLASISFTLPQGSTVFSASLVSDTLLSIGDSPVELGTLPTLDNIIFSSVPVWESFTPPSDLSYAAGTTVLLDFPVYATDHDGDTITYKADVGHMVGATFFGLAGVPQISLTLSNGHLTGSTTVPAEAVPGNYVLRLLADDNTTDTYNGTALDVPFSVTPNTLIGKWTLDGNAKDSSSIANHGSFNGNYVEGIHGQAADLSSGKVLISDIPAYTFGSAFSVGFWFNMNGETSGVFLGQDDGAYEHPKWFIDYNVYHGSRFDFHVNGPSKTYVPSDQVPISSGWNQFTFVKNGNDYGFYLNGINIGHQTFNGTFPDPVSNLIFGYAEPGHLFSGLMDDVVLYNRALTDEEIADLVDDKFPPELIASIPADNALAVGIGSNIVLTFSEGVKAGNGYISFTDGTDIHTIAITDSTQVTFSGKTVTINPTDDLQSGRNYHVEMSSGVIKDMAGNPSEAITLNFGTNTAPALSDFNSSGNLNTAITFTSTAFSNHFADIDAGDSLSAVKVTSLPGHGTLKVSGVDVTLNQEISSVNLANLRFVPNANWSGNDSFGWQATDGKAYSAASAVVNLTVSGNHVPVGYVSIEGNPLQGETLKASYDTLTDADFPNGIIPAEAIHYQWQADSANIDGATSETLELGQNLVGRSIDVIVSYTDFYPTEERVFSYNTVVIVNKNDKPTGGVTIEGAASAGVTLTANISTLKDADGLGDIKFQWYKGDKAIDGATHNTYTPEVSDIGNTIFVRASYWDGYGTWESVPSKATSPVTPSGTNNPASGTVTISGTATQNKTLIANFNIIDLDGVGGSVYKYQWQADNVAITGATNRYYQLKEAEVGKVMTVTVSFIDDAHFNESLTSKATRAVVNVNDPPTGTVTIKGTAAEDQTLTADISTLADADGPGVISFQWQADGVNIAGAVESSYTLTQAEVGTKMTVVASYTDGHGTPESPKSEATVVVANVNDAPTLFTGEKLIVGDAVVGEELFVNSGVLSDEDGPDVLSVTSYQWQADGITIDRATGSSYVLTTAEIGKAITVTVTYTDAFNTPEHFTSAATTAVVANEGMPDGTVVINGNLEQGATVTASVTDADGISNAISYQWQTNDVNIAGATGATLLLKEAQVGKTIKVITSYQDNSGTIESPSFTTTDSVANVNDKPAGIVIISGTVKQGETLIATNTLSDADGLGEITYQWQAAGETIDGATKNTYTLTQKEVGKAITVVASYHDGHGYAEQVPGASTVPVMNLNDPPTGIVKITGGGQQGEMLTASNTLADADGMGDVSYQWQANGVNISGAENESYQLTQAEVGKSITVTASYTDGGGTPENIRSAATSAILNVNDKPTGGITIDGTAKQGQRLTVNSSALYDVDGIPAQKLLSYQWQAGGLNIHGATDSSYRLTQAEVGKSITVKLSYIDLQGTSESVWSAATGNVSNVNDLPTGTVTITGTLTQGETLSANNNLVDSDGPPALAISYQWQADGVDIAGGVGRYYELTQADVGKRMAVVASYTDAFNKTEQVSSTPTAAVANSNDAPTGGVTISGNATQGQTLTAITSALADADGLGSFTYQWQANGEDIIGATGSSYTLTNSETGKAIKVIVSYTDDFEHPESVVSSQTRLVMDTNDAPTGSVTITGTLTQGATLTASNTLADLDGLGTITYQWQADGETIDGAIESTWKLTQDEVGKKISVVASYTDGHKTRESIFSAVTAPIANVDDPPTGSVTVSGTAIQGQTLTVTNTLEDADGLGAISYQWTAAGSNIVGAYGSSLTLTESQVGKKIAVVASYTDGEGHHESVNSNNTATVKNLNDLPMPTTGGVTISGALKVGRTLTADNTLTDADGLGAISYQWQANSQDIDGATDREYTLTTSEKGQTITVLASYTDGHGTKENVTSAATDPVKAVIQGSAHDGYLVNALVWVDDNNDTVRDWTDNNHNGIWDEGEGESWTLTDSTGQFTGLEGTGVLRITANPNGETIDISTGNDFTGSFAAPSDSAVISALTTLVAAAIDGTTDAAAASAKVKKALALDASVTITNYDPIAEASKTSTDNAARLVAIKAQSATLQVNNIMDVAVSVARAASATANTAQVVEKVADSLLAQAGSGTVDLAGSTVIAIAIVAGIPSGATHAPSDAVVKAIADALALANSEIAHTANTATGTTATAVAEITAIVEAQIVVQNTIVPDAYAAVAANDAGVVTTNSNNFASLLNDASGQVETIFVNHQPTGNVTISGVVMPGETLTAANSLVDVEGAGPISYQWLRNGIAIDGETHETYALTAADIGKAITVKASYTDGTGHIESVNSDPTALLPDVPTSLSDVVVGAASLTNNTIPTVTADLSNKVLEVGDIIQIIDSNHNNHVVSSHTITAQDLALLTAQDIELLVSFLGLVDDTHALKIQLVDGAGNAGSGSNSITAVTVDTTLPAITNPAYASGVVTATLDAALETGDKLYGSLDNGAHWSDITGEITGTAINWDGISITNDSVVQLKVTDIAGNESITNVSVSGYDLTVHTNYWNNDKAMSGVLVDSGIVTSHSGVAIINNIPAGAKTLTPALTASQADKGAVDLLDAINILKSIVGLTTFNTYQQIAADFDKANGVDLNDAIGILKHVVGLSAATPEWVFVAKADTTPDPVDPIHVTIPANTSVDLVGVLLGDVDGSWANF